MKGKAILFWETKFRDYTQLLKVRLSLLVVFSASMAYLWATHRNVKPHTIFLLSIGGFLVTGAANVINQVLERTSDKLMKRTKLRPLPDERMQVPEALVVSGICAVTGLYLLYCINPLSALIGAAAIVIYGFVYTPLKKKTWLTILPGAFAGSLPVVIGFVAATGKVTNAALILFLIQFIWQFPHTWSIAWLQNDEYKKSGIHMLPSAGGKCKASAFVMMMSTFLMIPAAFLLAMYESAGIHVCWMIALAGVVLSVFSFAHYRNRSDKTALRLMLSSIAYLPVILIILVVEKMLLP